MKKYIFTAKGMKEAKKLKVSLLFREAGLSRTTIDQARKTGIFSEKTLTAFFEKNIVNFTEELHYIKYNPNAVRCASCNRELHDTKPHTCEVNN